MREKTAAVREVCMYCCCNNIHTGTWHLVHTDTPTRANKTCLSSKQKLSPPSGLCASHVLVLKSPTSGKRHPSLLLKVVDLLGSHLRVLSVILSKQQHKRSCLTPRLDESLLSCTSQSFRETTRRYPPASFAGGALISKPQDTLSVSI